MLKKILLLSFIMQILTMAQTTELWMPAIFGDNMVLQQNTDVTLWGKAAVSQRVFITSSWGREAAVTPDANGRWKTKLQTAKLKSPQWIKVVSGDKTIQMKNILLGEVWLCSGQSNMEMPLAGWPPNDTILNSAKEIAEANNSMLRVFTVQRAVATVPLEDCTGTWVVCSPEEAGKFSATGYFFGKELSAKLKTPVGLIHSSWGGTPNQSWMSAESAGAFEEYKNSIDELQKNSGMFELLKQWREKHKIVEIASKAADSRWKNLSFEDDKCSLPEYDDSKWSEMKLPELWENGGLVNFDGVVWFRKKLSIPKGWINTELTIELGPIDDMDRSFVNGEIIGAAETDGMWNVKRKYSIPAAIVNSDTLLLAIRVVDNQGGGGLYGTAEDLKLINNKTGESVSLNGSWKYLSVAEFLGGKFYCYGSDPAEFAARPKVGIELSAWAPTALYNAMIAPVVPFSLSGAIWYQGEANASEPELYTKTFPAMILNWRDKFGIKDMPFYFVQIAPYNYGNTIASQYLREAQLKTLSVKNTGMAVTLDIGNPENIHPANKADVGKRLANLALHHTYKKKIVSSGPLYKSTIQKDGKLILSFELAAKGLQLKPIKGENNFEIAGKDGVFKKALVSVNGAKLVVSHPEINNPVAVRYCWSNTQEATLFNSAGLPSSSFRTDSWERLQK